MVCLFVHAIIVPYFQKEFFFMAKSKDVKKEAKKAPTKSLKEKREAKRLKKAEK